MLSPLNMLQPLAGWESQKKFVVPDRCSGFKSPFQRPRLDSGIVVSPPSSPLYMEFSNMDGANDLFIPYSRDLFELDLLSDELYKIIKDQSKTFSLFQSPEYVFSMFIDQERWCDSQWTHHEEGPIGRFDIKEPGYMRAMLSAAIALFQHNDVLTADFIEHIHMLCVKDVRDGSNSSDTLLGRYRDRSDGYEGFGLVWGESVSKAGIAELSANVASYKVKVLANGRPIPEGIDIDDRLLGGYVKSLSDLELTLSSEDFTGCSDYVTKSNEFDQIKWDREFPLCTKHSLAFRAKVNRYIDYLKISKNPIYKLDRIATSVIKYTVDFFLEEYYTNIKDAKDEDSKIKCIVKLCQSLDQLHPFTDGNIRLFGMLLLNYLLIRNQISPCVLTDPNCLDLLSINELLLKVKEGQKNFIATPIELDV